MKTFNEGLVLLCFLLVNNHSTDAAGNLFNAFGTMIGMDNKNINDQPFSQPLLPLNPNGNGNNNLLPNTGFNNNLGETGMTNNNNGNFQFKFIDPYKDPEIETKIASKLRLGTELSEDEKLAAEKFPGIKNLLDKLKELNRQKELQKQKDNENNGFNNGGLPNTNNNGGLPNNNNGGSPNINNGGFPNFNNNGDASNGNGDENNVDAKEEQVPGKGISRWLKLKKRKFSFQAQPVRPENEIIVEPEIVYYLN